MGRTGRFRESVDTEDILLLLRCLISLSPAEEGGE